MTTIAANKTTIACDLQFTYGSAKFKGKTKIFAFPKEKALAALQTTRALVGVAGKADQIADLVYWLHDGEPSSEPPKIKHLELLALTEKGELWWGKGLRSWIRLDEPFWAIGSGMDFALGAMKQGATPLEAVKIAASKDINTGLGFQEFLIKD